MVAQSVAQASRAFDRRFAGHARGRGGRGAAGGGASGAGCRDGAQMLPMTL